MLVQICMYQIQGEIHMCALKLIELYVAFDKKL